MWHKIVHMNTSIKENESFYQEMKSFTDFKSFTNPEIYRKVPEDWTIIISDIKGSTKAIESGRYKDVNLIGAASITSIINLFPKFEFPFVFGGDGSSLILPNSKIPDAIKELSKLAKLSEKNYGLHLRVAAIPLSKLNEENYSVLVSKYEITKGRNIAVFRGGGLGHADELAKSNYDEYRVSESLESIKELENISCRWSPIEPQNDLVISLIVTAQNPSQDLKSYGIVVTKITEILNGEIEDANPINSPNMTYNNLLSSISEESKFFASIFTLSFLKRLFEIFLSILIFKLKINPLWFIFNKDQYAKSMAVHSDFRKFDDTLRLILDCTENQVKELEKCLESYYREGIIYYGMFSSKSALMTCFVQDLGQGNHLHFVDGGDGGLAMAAKRLKLQRNI